ERGSRRRRSGGAFDAADRKAARDQRVDPRPALLGGDQWPGHLRPDLRRADLKEVKRLTIGQGGSNIGFSKDGKTAFIAVRGANDVAVIDIEKLALATRIKAGTEPQGLIVR